MKTFSTLAVMLALLFSACHKPLGEEHLIYTGAWSSSKHYIEIGASGYGYYQKGNRLGVESKVRVTNKKIIFNWDGGRKSFRIDTPPSVELTTGRIFMVLDNRDFYKH